MKIEGYKQPKSSFLAMEKDMGIIIDEIMKNQRLKRLLHYTSKDALKRPNLTEDESLDLIGKNIKMVPKVYFDGSVFNYIIISFDNFTQSQNPEFRDSIIEFDIICHFDQWQLQDFSLRPYKIAGELDAMFNNAKLTGIGELKFIGANQMILTDEYAGLCLMYQATHGGEDNKFMPNPVDEEQFQKDFEDYIGE